MTKHVEWLAQHPTTAIVYEPCSFCTDTARYSLSIVHSMMKTTPVTSCGDVRCLLRLYLIFTAQDDGTRSLAHYGACSDVCIELLTVSSLLVQDVQCRLGADWRPLPELIEQVRMLEENKARSYERLEKVA